MTKTVSLDPAEWKTLALNGVGQLHAFYSGINAPDVQQLQTVSAHLDRIKAFALAWHMSQFPPVVHMNPRQVTPVPTPEALGLSVVVSDIPGEKRKGGWPKGKKRARNGAGAHAS